MKPLLRVAGWVLLWAASAGMALAADAVIERGAALAALGNCAGCHTRAPAPAYAGGVPLATPFGVIYGTNITPDGETGIGRWSEADFDRALTAGVDAQGGHLYPAFPYPHFTYIDAFDLHALYAFIATRVPVTQVNRANAIEFPFDVRALLAVWNGLFLRRDSDVATTQGGEAARGEQLVRSLGHCGACHTPRNRLGAEENQLALDGARISGWYAPALNADNPSPVPWTQSALLQYLQTGIAPQHAIAAGPMREVVLALSRARPEDVAAMAQFLADTMGPADEARQRRSQDAQARAAVPLAAIDPGPDATMRRGARVYAAACASCHDAGRGEASAQALQMPLAVALYDPDPRSFLQIVREGVAPPSGSAGRVMPAFHAGIDDADLAALAQFLRAQAAHAAPWDDLPCAIEETHE